MSRLEERKLRILQVAPEFPPYLLGGGGLLVLNLSKELLKQGHSVNVLSGYYPASNLFEKQFETKCEGIRVKWVPLIPTLKTGFQLNTYMPPNLKAAIKTLLILRERDFDVIHIHGFGHLFCDFISILCHLLCYKYIVTIHGIPKEPVRRGGLLKVIFCLYRKSIGAHLVRYASKTVAVSNSVALECSAYIPKNKIAVIPNAIDLQSYFYCPFDKIEKIRSKFGLNGKKILLCIGRLSELKGFQFVIQSLKRLTQVIPNTHLVITGRDEGYGYFDTLRSIVTIEGVESAVTFTGGVSDDEKVALLWLADVVVIPSVDEAFGIVALEALAAGAPIVASNLGGLKEILSTDKYSLLVKSTDVEELTYAIIKVLRDEKIALGARSNRFLRVKQFGLQQMVNSYINLYRCLDKNNI